MKYDRFQANQMIDEIMCAIDRKMESYQDYTSHLEPRYNRDEFLTEHLNDHFGQGFTVDIMAGSEMETFMIEVKLTINTGDEPGTKIEYIARTTMLRESFFLGVVCGLCEDFAKAILEKAGLVTAKRRRHDGNQLCDPNMDPLDSWNFHWDQGSLVCSDWIPVAAWI